MGNPRRPHAGRRRAAGAAGVDAGLPHLWPAVALFTLASGFSALVYEVLWLKELGLLFGNTAHASSVGLAIFFAGLAGGGWFWGSRAASMRRPLMAYAWLEVAIAVAALPFFWLMDLYRGVYAPLHAAAGDSPALFLAARTALACAVFFPPAFFMGGTIPLLGQGAIARAAQLGRRGAALYGLNTAGAAAGALAAGFYLPAALGFRAACLVAVAINLAIAGAAFVLASRTPAVGTLPAPPARDTASSVRIPGVLWGLAAASGFLTLGLEVAATRLFAQVLQNSVYTFSTVLVVFLASLACGSMVASRLARLDLARPWTVLAGVLAAAGLGVAAVPFGFLRVTGGLGYLAAAEGWGGYVASVFGTALLILGPPCVVAGIAFPFLLRLAQDRAAGVGAVLGRLAAWNTVGAIAGSLITGFVLLPTVGLWRTFTLLAAAYLVAAALVLARQAAERPVLQAVPLTGVLVLLTVLSPSGLPLLRVDTTAGETVIDIRESVYGVTAVVERGGDRMIKVNNHYSLGGSGSLEHERNQALIPLLAHPSPRSVFFLGMGTGITAGAAVQPFVERLVVAELIPDVVTAARLHFRAFANGLFDDPRVEIVVADGRNHLAAVPARYDLIISDLFVPWEAGTGSLYTREHFRTARERLTPAGAFVQWLPLYQMSRTEFMTVARTMLDVFPDVRIWRGDFFPHRPIVALVGTTGVAPIDPDGLAARGRDIAGSDVPPEAMRALTLPFYAGRLSAARHLVPDGPLNTDDRPIIEYGAPITHRQQRTGAAAWFTSTELLDFFRAVLDAAPPEHDPYLARLDPAEREWVRAGFHYHAAEVHRRLGNETLAAAHRQEFAARVPAAFRMAPGDEPADRAVAGEQSRADPGSTPPPPTTPSPGGTETWMVEIAPG
jgi:spermidine synthase